ncbi:hypothetical protein F2P81_011081 [Scophthalmus maximus]|uniref:Uncharacterized protein n=1 Tax=Scophthalmus maximus TaxID=52904 RepID=A0A6A4SSU6_SCOMX|nr:hypothetical protein F2P81_011081 [Scophthalmus maximus]
MFGPVSRAPSSGREPSADVYFVRCSQGQMIQKRCHMTRDNESTALLRHDSDEAPARCGNVRLSNQGRCPAT